MVDSADRAGPTRSSKTLHEIALLLLQADGRFVSGQEIGRWLNISRPAVGKHVEGLGRLGYEVESRPNRGHRIITRPDRLLPTEIEDGLATERLGRPVHYFDRVASTQPIARQLADAGAPEGTLVVAEEQVAGRGRMGRAYVSPIGGIWFSIILRPQVSPAHMQLMALTTGLAVAEAIEDVCGFRPILKWPNDVLLGERKVCGVLTDMSTEHDLVHYLVVGVGINANLGAAAFPAEVRPVATSLQIETGKPVARRLLLQRVLMRLESHYALVRQGQSGAVLENWRAWPNVLSRRVQVIGLAERFEGVAEDLAADGALLLRLDDRSVVRVVSGDVNLRAAA